MSATKTNIQRGFTIVELLIVIVVIAILAAISIVAYNGIQDRGRDSANLSQGKGLAKALEIYRIDNGDYPICGSVDGSSCNVSDLSSKLVPAYLSSIPKDGDTTKPYSYVGTNPVNDDDKWAIRMYKRQIGGYCKIGSPNMLVGWYASAPDC